MKRKLASAIVVFGLLASSMTPASAVFGLSKCEKVKKQILAWQEIEKPMIKDWQNYAGDWIWSYPSESHRELQNRWKNIVNLEVKMYSLEINNPKCFTNSQNLYIKDVYPKWKKYQQINN